MTDAFIHEVWEPASGFDAALRASAALWRSLAPRRIAPRPWSREALFEAAARGRPALLSGVRVPVTGASRIGLAPALVRLLEQTFRDPARDESYVRAQVGPSRTRRRLTVAELLRRWSGDRHVVSVTDLHIRGTRLERDIDTSALSSFNLLPLGDDDMRRQEMMTLVVSSRGNVTDSHSDDPDGSNHCFVGRKLWLAWDTFEGRAARLQDCSRDLVHDHARFSLAAFSRLRSACWWTVEPGQTLFLPGRLTHRVITLDPYIGIGSFYCTPASVLENLSRWYAHGALWSLDDPAGENAHLVDDIAASMAARLHRLAAQSARARRRWGLDFARAALDGWKRRVPATERRAAQRRPAFARVLQELQAAAA